MSEYITIYSTFKNKEQAHEVARALVLHKLAACVNIIPVVESVYSWQGKLESSTEAAFIAKTTKKLFAEARNLIVQMHSYEVPCIVSYEINEGFEPFLGWIEKETQIPNN